MKRTWNGPTPLAAAPGDNSGVLVAFPHPTLGLQAHTGTVLFREIQWKAL